MNKRRRYLAKRRRAAARAARQTKWRTLRKRQLFSRTYGQPAIGQSFDPSNPEHIASFNKRRRDIYD